jgi:hypothetical protein
VLGVAWYRFRTTFRRRWGGYLSVILLIGLVGGLAMGSVAGARRTASSFSTYLASTRPSTIEVFSGFSDPALGLKAGYVPRIVKGIGRLPSVEHAATVVGFNGNIDTVTGAHLHITAGETPPTVIGSIDGEYASQDRVSLVKGHLADPDRSDEAVMNAQAAQELGVHIGSVIHIGLYTDAEENSNYGGKPHAVARVKLVGEVIFSDTVVQDDIDALGSGVVLLSQALTRELAPCCAYYSQTFLALKGGDSSVGRVRDAVSRLLPGGTNAAFGGSEETSTFVTKAQQSITPQAIALGVFGGLAGLAALLIAGQVVGRILRVGADEAGTLRALGASPAMTLCDSLAGLLGAIIVGSLLAAAVAIGLSPLTPLGPVRPVYPSSGIACDWTVLGFGVVALIVILGSLSVILARREASRLSSPHNREAWRPEPAVVRSAATAGLPTPVLTGLRFALDSGRGRSTAPVRSAILGAVLAVVVLVATVTFGASLDNLVSHPALYGWNWNFAMLSGYAGQEDLPQGQIATLLDHDREIAAWSGANFASAKLDGQTVQMLTERPGAPVAPPLLSGHGLLGTDQVVLGRTTLAALHKRVGDTVTFTDGLAKPRRLRIVGTATMPTISDGLDMGTGAAVATTDFPAALLNPQEDPIPGPNAILVRVRAGTSSAAAYHSLIEINIKVDAIPNDDGPAGGVVSVLRPAEIVNYRSMGTTPAILGTGLAVGALVALGLTLVASVRRRRRDLALLKTLGFTQRQLAAAVAWQSSVAVAVGIVIGVPVGIVVGRFLWDLFAHEINAVPVPGVPALSIALIAVGALVLANVVAAIPGRIAARTPTALVLRAE